LIVDDETGVAEMIGDILEDAGYAVEIRTDARKALSELDIRTFDAILSDIKMPGLDGPGFHTAVLDHNPGLAKRIGFITGDTLTPSVSAFLAGAGQPHLEKPITPDEVLGLVAGLIEKGSP
jgi:CheY-like chemotaxis protein